RYHPILHVLPRRFMQSSGPTGSHADGKRYKRSPTTEPDAMLLISRRLATGMLLVPFAGLLLAGAAPAAATRVTFLPVTDLYLRADDLMPDGTRRRGFPRLAAVVKAEREMASTTGSRVIFAHGGDTLSPSLMSGIDKGAHIMTLTNMIPPDIFAPGNHE